jgi:hypothetical protein
MNRVDTGVPAATGVEATWIPALLQITTQVNGVEVLQNRGKSALQAARSQIETAFAPGSG